MRWKGICAGLAAGVVAGLALGGVRVQGADGRTEVLVRQFFRPLAWLVRQIEQNYVEEVDRSTLLEGTYQGMIGKADPGGDYIPAEMTERYGPGADGTIPELGLTARFLPLKKAVVLDGTVPGRPAFQAGLLAGDYILKIGEATADEAVDTEGFRTSYDAVRALHGEVGTAVALTVLRVEDGAERQVELTRSLGPTPTVRAVDIVDAQAGIGYLALTQFNERTVGQLFAALTELEDRGARGALLDLRFNPGGPLDSAVMCADLLLSRGVILGARGRAGKEATQEAEEGSVVPEMKLALLVNGYTAGAAEVMAAALADNGRATLVGQQTPGRGSVRTALDCPYDGSTIRLAVARCLRPNREEIEGKGLQPDVEASIPPEDVAKLAAHLAGRLEPGPGTPQPDAEAEEPFADVQLEQAIEHMRDVLAGRPEAVGAAGAVEQG